MRSLSSNPNKRQHIKLTKKLDGKNDNTKKELENRGTSLTNFFDLNNKNFFVTKNKNVLLIPTRHNGTKVVGKYKLNEQVNLKKSLLKNTTLSVSDYEIKNKFVYKYEACMRNNCESITDVVTADATNAKTLIQLNAKLNLDNTSTFALNTSKKLTFYDTFVTIGYDNKISSVRDVTPGSSIEDTILEVDEDIINAESLNLLVTARGKQYIIKLK